MENSISLQGHLERYFSAWKITGLAFGTFRFLTLSSTFTLPTLKNCLSQGIFGKVVLRVGYDSKGVKTWFRDFWIFAYEFLDLLHHVVHLSVSMMESKVRVVIY